MSDQLNTPDESQQERRRRAQQIVSQVRYPVITSGCESKMREHCVGGQDCWEGCIFTRPYSHSND
jgi:hypothetical protein